MSFLDDFGTEKKYTATFETPTPTNTNGIVSYTWATTGTASCLMWNASTAKITVSEKYKQEIEAIAIFNYSDITFTIPQNGRVTINSKLFSIMVSEDVAEQNEIIQVLLKKYES